MFRWANDPDCILVLAIVVLGAVLPQLRTRIGMIEHVFKLGQGRSWVYFDRNYYSCYNTRNDWRYVCARKREQEDSCGVYLSNYTCKCVRGVIVARKEIFNVCLNVWHIGILMLSDDITTLSAERLRLVESILPTSKTLIGFPPLSFFEEILFTTFKLSRILNIT